MNKSKNWKRWWKKYGAPIVGGLAIGLIAVFGSRAWFDYQERQRVGLGGIRTAAARTVEQQSEAARQRGAYLMDSYARTLCLAGGAGAGQGARRA